MRVLKFGGTSVADEDAIARVTAIVAAEARARAAPAVRSSSSPRSAASPTSCSTSRRVADAGAARTRRTRSRRCASATCACSPRVAPGDAAATQARTASSTSSSRTWRRWSTRWRCFTRPRRARWTPIAAMGEIVSARIVTAAFAHAGPRRHRGRSPRAHRHRRDTSLRRVPSMETTGAQVRDALRPLLSRRQGRRDRRLRRRHAQGRRDDARARRVGLLRGNSSARRSTPTEIQIWTDVDGMLTADPRVVATSAAGAGAVVRGGRRARVLRREGAAPQDDSARCVAEHPGPHPQHVQAVEAPGRSSPTQALPTLRR